jgi:hypothetical protein
MFMQAENLILVCKVPSSLSCFFIIVFNVILPLSFRSPSRVLFFQISRHVFVTSQRLYYEHVDLQVTNYAADVRSEAFTTANGDKIFSEYQPCQLVKNYLLFSDNLCPHPQDLTEIHPGTSVIFFQLIRSIS